MNFSGRCAMTGKLFAAAACAVGIASAQDLAADSWRQEARGEGAQVQTRLSQAARQSPNDVGVLSAYAEFLDRHHDPGCLDAYDRLLQAMDRANTPAAQRAPIAKRLTVLSLAAGDR